MLCTNSKGHSLRECWAATKETIANGDAISSRHCGGFHEFRKSATLDDVRLLKMMTTRCPSFAFFVLCLLRALNFCLCTSEAGVVGVRRQREVRALVETCEQENGDIHRFLFEADDGSLIAFPFAFRLAFPASCPRNCGVRGERKDFALDAVRLGQVGGERLPRTMRQALSLDPLRYAEVMDDLLS